MKIQDPNAHKWYVLDIFFIVAVLVLMFFFMCLEFYQVKKRKLGYFTEIWNYLDISSWALNIAFIASDLNGVDPFKVRPLGTMCIAVIWMKLFYFLRLFNPTSSMIRMISEVTKDISSFGFVLFVAMVAWANVYFILDINEYNY